MLDFEALAYTLLDRGVTELTVVPELDVDTIEDFPILMFTVSGGQAISGTNPPNAWEVTLDITIMAEGMDAARALAGEVYLTVWSWNDQWNLLGLVDGLGHVAEVNDQAIFTRIVTAMIAGREITQYSGSFTMQMHKA